MQEQPKISLETPEQEAERLQASVPKAPSVMDNLRSAQESGDPAKVAEAQIAADEKYIIKPTAATRDPMKAYDDNGFEVKVDSFSNTQTSFLKSFLGSHGYESTIAGKTDMEVFDMVKENLVSEIDAVNSMRSHRAIDRQTPEVVALLSKLKDLRQAFPGVKLNKQIQFIDASGKLTGNLSV